MRHACFFGVLSMVANCAGLMSGFVQQGSRHAPPPDQIKDQAKQWLSAGQKWLSGASKKVAQAVKETQATISSKLEELDVRGKRPLESNVLDGTSMALQLLT